MKIQVDILNKTIKVEGNINFYELSKHIKQFLPDGQWKEYELETNTVINWNTGHVYPTYPIYPSYPTYEPYYPTITCEGIDFSASNTLTNVINTTSGTIVNFEVT